jgi:hypothetical protein
VGRRNGLSFCRNRIRVRRFEDPPGPAQTGKTAAWNNGLKADGDDWAPAKALAEKGFRRDELARVATVKRKSVAFVMHPAALAEISTCADIVVSCVPLNSLCPTARGPHRSVDLWRESAHAVYLEGQLIRVETVPRKRGQPSVDAHNRRTDKKICQ